MKKIIIVAIATLITAGTFAQVKVDRKKQPPAGPAPVLSIGEPVVYKLANGITVLVVENHKLPSVSASYYVDYGPVLEGNKAGVLQMMGRMLNEGTTEMSKAAYDEAVDQLGARVSLSSSGANVSALTKYFDKAFALMAQGLLKPAFKQESLDKIKSQEITGLKSNERSAKAISGRVVGALTFGLNHPSGEFETEESLKSITLDDINAYYKKYISSSRGFLTFVGDIKPLVAKNLAEKAFANWKGTPVTIAKFDDAQAPAKTEIDLIDVPNAVQTEITVTNVVKIPMNSPDYFPVLLANNILGGNSDARLFMNLREKRGFTYGSYSNIGTGRFQTAFSATAAVRNEKVDSAVMEILNEINNIRSNKVSAEELKNAKALYAGNFALGLEDKSRTAAFARNIIINDLPKNFYTTYLQKINAVTTEDIQRVAQKYFNYSNTRVVVVGKASVVEPGLRKLGHEVKMFDRFAKPVQVTNSDAITPVPAQSQTAVVSAGVSAQEIINKYINAVGGASELKKINSVLLTGKMNVQGMSLDMSKKQMAPNLSLTEMSMGGRVAMKQMFNGTTGYREQMGNKATLSADEIEENVKTKGLFPQLFYNDGTYTLTLLGKEKINGSDAYKVAVKSVSGKTVTEYYDVTSSLLVKRESVTTVQGQEIPQITEFTNYKKVGNVMLPHTEAITVTTPMGEQTLSLEADNIKVNEGVKTEDFK